MKSAINEIIFSGMVGFLVLEVFAGLVVTNLFVGVVITGLILLTSLCVGVLILNALGWYDNIDNACEDNDYE